MGNPSSLRAILREFLTRYPSHFVLLITVLVVEGVVGTASVLSVVPLADFMLNPTLTSPSGVTRAFMAVFQQIHVRPSFGTFGLVFVGSNLVTGLVAIATRYAILRIKYTVTRGLFGDALSEFFHARWQFFSGADQGRLLNTLNREMAQMADTLGHLATQLAQIVQLCIYLTVPIWLSARVTFTALGLSLLFGSPLLLLRRTSYRLGQRNTETGNVLMGVLSEVLAAARLVLGFGRQYQSRVRFLKAFDEHMRVTLLSQTLQAAAAVFSQPIGILAAVCALGLAMTHGLPMAEMAGLLFSLLRVFPLLGGILSTNVTISNFLPSYQQLQSLRREARILREHEGPHGFEMLVSGVQLQNVTFAYPGRLTTISNVNLQIQRGKTTALVGESGSGKSTISDLVLGLQVPDGGEVFLDGHPLAYWNLNSFRERIGYVPQDPMLFHASIRDNLLWSFEKATESELWDACRLANAEAFLRELPNGIDTIVGDRGVRLSGGQRQRIALARALLRKPELLILDEATSSLDSESERLIQQAIDTLAKDCTMLVIAHRLSTIARADHVYVLDHGRVVEEGTYAELAARPGSLFAAMIAFQNPIESPAAVNT